MMQVRVKGPTAEAHQRQEATVPGSGAGEWGRGAAQAAGGTHPVHVQPVDGGILLGGPSISGGQGADAAARGRSSIDTIFVPLPAHVMALLEGRIAVTEHLVTRPKAAGEAAARGRKVSGAAQSAVGGGVPKTASAGKAVGGGGGGGGHVPRRVPCEACTSGRAEWGLRGEWRRRWCTPCSQSIRNVVLLVLTNCEACRAPLRAPGFSGSERLCDVCNAIATARNEAERRANDGRLVGSKCRACLERTATFGRAGDTGPRFCGQCAPWHGAFSFNQRCRDCGMRAPQYGNADNLLVHQKMRSRRWCGSCAARFHPDAVFVPWPCFKCKRKTREFAAPGKHFPQWCADCAPSIRGAVQVAPDVGPPTTSELHRIGF